jgi:signal transduction histidine kinase
VDWWDSAGNRTCVDINVRGCEPLRVYVVAGLGVLLGAAGLVFKVDQGAHSATSTVVIAVGGFLFVGAGVLAHVRRPDNGVGLLMVLVGVGSFAEDVQFSSTPWVHTAGLMLTGVSSGFAAHLVLAFPYGRLKSWLERMLVGTSYAAVFVLLPVGALFNDTSGRPVPRENLLLIVTDVPVHRLVNRGVEIIGVVVAVAVVAVLVRRWVRASSPMRRVLAPVYLAGLVGGIATVVGQALGGEHPLRPVLLWVYWTAFCLLPLGFLVGVLRVELGRTAVGTLLTRLQETLSAAQLRAALAQALDDPTLQLGYWRPDTESFVDGDGKPLRVPGIGSERAFRLVERAGRRVAVLVHDRALLDNVPLLDAVTAAAGLALDNQRLTAEALAEMRASRARIVAASDAERRRLERDLHDGAQQRLVAAAVPLRMARQRLDRAADAQTVDLLDNSAAQLQAAVGELRRLAGGLHPAVLADAGLVPALRTLAQGTHLDVRLHADALPRLKPAVEATGYFVVAEALTNAMKHAEAHHVRITVEHRDDQLHIEVDDDGVGGADIGTGSGLLGLCDRVSALDGTLTVRSSPGQGTCVVADIPAGEA